MLLPYHGRLRYWLYTAPADMRKGFDCLNGLVRDQLKQDPLAGDVLIFISRSRVNIKILYWHGDGIALYCKRFERGRFDHPASAAVGRELRRSELAMLLEDVRLVEVRL